MDDVMSVSALDVVDKKHVQWTHLHLISFAIALVILLVRLFLKSDVGGAIANESTVVS